MKNVLLIILLICVAYCVCYNPYLFGYIIPLISGGLDKRDKEIVLVLGSGGVGKSTYVSDQKGYYPILLDVVVDEWKKSDPSISHVDVYKKDEYTEELVARLKKIIGNRNKVIIEGSLWNINTIKTINPTKIIYMVPKSRKAFQKRMFQRFIEQPLDYGRLNVIRHFDKNESGLRAYRIERNPGPIRGVINRAVSWLTDKDEKNFEEFQKHFPRIEKILI